VSFRDTLIQLGFVALAAGVVVAVRTLFVFRFKDTPNKPKARPKRERPKT
jgi:hypothetical protein